MAFKIPDCLFSSLLYHWSVNVIILLREEPYWSWKLAEEDCGVYCSSFHSSQGILRDDPCNLRLGFFKQNRNNKLDLLWVKGIRNNVYCSCVWKVMTIISIALKEYSISNKASVCIKVGGGGGRGEHIKQNAANWL